MGKIELRGIIAYAYHGALPEEQVLGQRFEVDVVLEYDMSRIGESDDLAHGVDYGKVYDVVLEVVQGPPVQTLEHLVGLVNRRILQDFSLVEMVRTRIKKPSVPIAGPLAYAAVERTLQR